MYFKSVLKIFHNQFECTSANDIPVDDGRNPSTPETEIKTTTSPLIPRNHAEEKMETVLFKELTFATEKIFLPEIKQTKTGRIIENPLHYCNSKTKQKKKYVTRATCLEHTIFNP